MTARLTPPPASELDSPAGLVDLSPLARPTGTFAMVAMDQRESLRTMLAEATGTEGSAVADEALVAFKLAVARTLGPLSSGFLIDRHLVLEEVRHSDWLGGGLLLAADALTQPLGGPVEDTGLDHVVTDELDLTGVAALKLLVVWRRDERRAARVELARSFVAAARRRGVLSVLEPVVRATPAELAAGSWDADLAAREAATELSPLGPDLYKAQVPGAGAYPPADLERACARLGDAIAAPWVVLSQGVPLDRFPAAVTLPAEVAPAGSSPGGRCGPTCSARRTGRRRCARCPYHGWLPWPRSSTGWAGPGPTPSERRHDDRRGDRRTGGAHPPSRHPDRDQV